MYEALELDRQTADVADENPSGMEGSLRQPTPHIKHKCIKTTHIKTKIKVVAISYSLLKGTEGPIYQSDPTNREDCSLPGVRVRDVTTP